MEEMKRHPLSAAFGTMGEADRAELKASIERDHDHVEIVTRDGMILDGWHRYRCMLALGLDPTDCFVELPDGIDPTDFALRANEHRRHISKLDRAKARIKCYRWREANGGEPVPSHRDLARDMGVSTALTQDALKELDGIDTREERKKKKTEKDSRSVRKSHGEEPARPEQAGETPTYEDMQARMKVEKAERDKARAEAAEKEAKEMLRQSERRLAEVEPKEGEVLICMLAKTLDALQERAVELGCDGVADDYEKLLIEVLAAERRNADMLAEKANEFAKISSGGWDGDLEECGQCGRMREAG